MTMIDIVRKAEKTFRDHSPVILTAIGVSGTLTTAYLAGRASFQAAEVLYKHNEEAKNDHFHPAKPTNKEKFKKVWKLYIPPVVSGVVTVGCIVGATRVGSKRAAAAYSLLSVSEKAFSEYKEKVSEVLGEKKEKALQDSVAQDIVSKNPPAGNIIVTGAGNVLCCELFTGRYFMCDMETLKRSQNTINSQLIREMYATLSDFYDLVGLPHTSHSFNVGWDSDKMMELIISATISEDGRPCIAFNYNYTKPM